MEKENVAAFHDRADCHTKQIEGNEVFFTAYSYRSYAISQRLKKGLDIYVASKLYGTSIKHLCDTYDYNLNEHFVDQITAHTKAEYQRFDFRGSSPEKVELKIATDNDAPTKAPKKNLGNRHSRIIVFWISVKFELSQSPRII